MFMDEQISVLCVCFMCDFVSNSFFVLCAMHILIATVYMCHFIAYYITKVLVSHFSGTHSIRVANKVGLHFLTPWRNSKHLLILGTKVQETLVSCTLVPNCPRHFGTKHMVPKRLGPKCLMSEVFVHHTVHTAS